MSQKFLVRKRIRGEYNYDDIPDPVDQFIAVFDSQETAAAYVTQYDRAYFLEHLPLTFEFADSPFDSGFANATSFPEPIFRDWLLDHGIPLPVEQPKEKPRRYRGMTEEEWDSEQKYMARRNEIIDWQQWWYELTRENTPSREQLAHIWQALDRFSSLEIVVQEYVEEVAPHAEKVFAVVEQTWEYGDDWYYGDNKSLAVYRTFEAAMREVERRKAEPIDHEDWNGGPREFRVVELDYIPENAD
ncbi:MAG: hypothetical protein R3B84_10750 [Zavarzinella sp.]